MSSATLLPLAISIAPFPEGFQGDMDETFQQAVLLMSAYIEGNFLSGLILPPGSTLPTSDQGPIAMGSTWYFWDPGSGQYQPQSVPVRFAKNFCRNPVYQVQQQGSSFSFPVTGPNPTYDMADFRCSIANVLSLASVPGPPTTPDNDNCPTAAQYSVAVAIPTLAPADLFAHEHMIEGADLAPLIGQSLSLAFSVMASATGAYSVYLTSSGRDESYVVNFQVPTANVWQRIKVQGIPAIPGTGTWNFTEGVTGMYIGVTLATGTQWQTSTPGTWVNAFCAGTASNSSLVSTVGNTIAVTGFKLEAASSATPLQVAAFGDDYQNVLRYFFTNFDYQSVSGGVPLRLDAPATQTWAAYLLFIRRMCKAPTVVPFGLQSFSPGHITNMQGGTAVDIAVAHILARPKGISDREAVTATGSNTTTGTIAALSFTGTTANGQSAITAVAVASAANVLPGATISGTGIPAGATVLSYNPDNTTLYISVPATASGSVTLTVSGPVITALASLTGIAIGQVITGTGVLAGTLVNAILSATSVLASKPITPGSGISLTFSTQAGVINLRDPLYCYFTADARLT